MSDRKRTRHGFTAQEILLRLGYHPAPKPLAYAELPRDERLDPVAVLEKERDQWRRYANELKDANRRLGQKVAQYEELARNLDERVERLLAHSWEIAYGTSYGVRALAEWACLVHDGDDYLDAAQRFAMIEID